MTVNLLPMVCAALPGLVLILALYGWQWRDQRRQRRAPVSDKLLRAPGQFLREEIARIDEQLITTLALCTFLLSLFLAATLRLPSGVQPIQFVVPTVVAIMFSAGGGWRMCKLLGERQRRRLGLSGECAVAEELNKLIAKDCRVFHDLADEKIGNIDHIVVGPTGVYAIETKTRSKVPSLSRQPDHEVSYDGKALTFPRYTDSDSLEQTRRNAQWLQTFLSSAVGETVEVQPVLALPGWFFSSGVRTSLKVLNPKMIPGLVASNPSVLSPRMIQQVTHQLEQKCRNVDF